MQHTLATKDKYFNVKFIIKLLNGLVVKRHYKVLSTEQLDRLTCNDVWNDGKTRSVTVYADGEFYCNWKLSRGEMPLLV